MSYFASYEAESSFKNRPLASVRSNLYGIHKTKAKFVCHHFPNETQESEDSAANQKKNKAENKRQKKHSEAYQKFRSRFALGKHFVLNVLSRHEKEKQASAVIYVT
jgi:hypothetical protein